MKIIVKPIDCLENGCTEQNAEKCRGCLSKNEPWIVLSDEADSRNTLSLKIE